MWLHFIYSQNKNKNILTKLSFLKMFSEMLCDGQSLFYPYGLNSFRLMIECNCLKVLTNGGTSTTLTWFLWSSVNLNVFCSNWYLLLAFSKFSRLVSMSLSFCRSDTLRNWYSMHWKAIRLCNSNCFPRHIVDIYYKRM